MIKVINIGQKEFKRNGPKKTRHNISSNIVDQQKLEIVLKCDVAGTAEAISASLAEINVEARCC